jgi:TadE-like protein
MRERQDGQATVELVALLPCLLAVLAAAWQLVLAGDAKWSAATAARAAARAAAVGADAEAAARRHLPKRLETGMRVTEAPRGRVRVTLAVPSVVHGLRPGRVSAEASFTPQEPR